MRDGEQAAPVQQFGGVYLRYCGKNTGQKALPGGMSAMSPTSARPVEPGVQILLIGRLRGRSSIRPPPCAQAVARPSPDIQCKEVQYQRDYLHLMVSSPLALSRGLAFGVFLRPARCHRRAMMRGAEPYRIAEDGCESRGRFDCAHPESARWEWSRAPGAWPRSAWRAKQGVKAPARAPFFCMHPEMPWACTGTLP